MSLRDAVNALVDILDCSRWQATNIIIAAQREGYRVANVEEGNR